jgi:hypothetical protein
VQDVVIILTGTVVPNVDFVSRTDVQQRVQDYIRCISFYLSETPHPIFFAENSGFDPNASKSFAPFLADERFRWASVEPHSNRSRGKGFQEFYTLDQLIGRGYGEPYFVKITGRYLVRNVNSLIRKMKAPLHIDLHRKMKVAITGFFGVDAGFYRSHLKGTYSEANDGEGRFIEHVIYNTIQAKQLSHQVDLLPENAIYEGVSGSHGGSMARNPYKMKIRSLERSINRSLGIRKFLIEY